MVASFIFFILCFVVIGMLSMRKRQETSRDYLIASSSIKPWLAGLSAVATNNSGYMFVGQIGFTYMYGLSSIWIMVGFIFGDFLTSLFVHKRIRQTTEKQSVLSYAGVLSSWGGVDYKYLRMVAGFITLLFLGVYAAAQLNAGSKALHVLLGWDYEIGAIIGALIVLVYCFAGGIRASIWTDAAQSFVMFGAMALMLVMSFIAIGGVGDFTDKIHEVSPTYMDWFSTDLMFEDSPIAAIFFVLGWLMGGVCVIGQPHIMVRFMAMDKANNIGKVRAYYYGFYVAFFIITILTALTARILLPEVASFDAELALPTLAQSLLPPVLVGLILAGLFAATMSTADSQILSCTAAITNDFSKNRFNSYFANKIATIFVTALALTIALFGSSSVFALVMIAWSTLGSSFAPLLITYAFGHKVSELVAIVMVITGFVTVLLWRHFELGHIIFDAAPGIMVGFVVLLLSKIPSFNKKVIYAQNG